MVDLKKMKYIFGKISFGNKIFAFNALIFIIALFMLAFFANRVSTQAILGKAQSSAVRELQLIDKNLETMVESIEDYSRMISSEYRLQLTLHSMYKNKQEGIEENQLNAVRINSLMSSIVSNIIAPSTQLVGSSILIEDEAIYNGYNLGNFDVYHALGDEYFSDISVLHKPVWSDLFPITYDTGTKKNVFAVGKQIINKDTGESIGTAVVFVDEVNISKIYLEQMKTIGFILSIKKIS